jgi:hypothetical protein
VGTQEARCIQVYFSTDKGRELILYGDESQTRFVSRDELDEQVDVAVWIHLVPRSGAKYSQALNAVVLTEFSEPSLVEVECVLVHYSLID